MMLRQHLGDTMAGEVWEKDEEDQQGVLGQFHLRTDCTVYDE